MKAIFLGIGVVALTASSALAVTTAEDVCKDGTPSVVRVSAIKAGGSRAGFDKAVQDQIAWYRSHGMKDNKIVVAEILEKENGKFVPSKTEVMTIHYNPPSGFGTPMPNDASHAAFVAEFQANSDIESEKIVCIPK